MQEPIPRSRLQTLKNESNIELVVQTIYDTVLREASIGRTYYHYIFPDVIVDRIAVLHRIRRLFPGCNIQMDLLHTYIVIRWE